MLRKVESKDLEDRIQKIILNLIALFPTNPEMTVHVSNEEEQSRFADAMQSLRKSEGINIADSVFMTKGAERIHFNRFSKAKDDPGLIPRLVEEAVRWTMPVHHVMRTATADVELRGQSVAKGDWIMLNYLSANRDEAAYDEPDCFRLAATRRSALFGQGVHTCLGQHLARLEMRIFFGELLPRLASVEIAGAPRRSASIFIGGPKTLPIQFKMH